MVLLHLQNAWGGHSISRIVAAITRDGSSAHRSVETYLRWFQAKRRLVVCEEAPSKNIAGIVVDCSVEDVLMKDVA